MIVPIISMIFSIFFPIKKPSFSRDFPWPPCGLGGPWPQEKDTHQLRAEAQSEEDPSKDDSFEPPEVLALRKRRERLAAALSKPSTDQLRRSFEATEWEN
jgi:hypothetical protein